MKIIPAIDILNGKCVRLRKGDYNTQTIYNENPLEVALEFEANGLNFLHVVDLDGARSRHIVNHKILEQLATRTKLEIDFGGGIKSDDDIRTAFACGAAKITAGSIAVDQPELVAQWLLQYGSSKIILGADCRNRLIATQGWENFSKIDVATFIGDYAAGGITDVICTDIEQDGMLQGPSLSLYRDIIAQVEINLIASGGISSLQDLKMLKDAGCAGAIIGKAIYEHKITFTELRTLC